MDTVLPDGKTASIRVHRTGSVEAMVGGHHYHLQPEHAHHTTTTTTTAPSSPPSKSSFINVNDLKTTTHHNMTATQPVSSPYLSPSSGLYRSAHSTNSRLASSVLGQTSFSSNIHNSRAVLAALRALQDKIRNLEVERSQFSHQNSTLQAELSNAKDKLHAEESSSTAEAQRLQQSTSELSIQKEQYALEQVRTEEKLSTLKMELDMVKEQAQRSATARKSAIDRLARVEVEADQSNTMMLQLKSDLLESQTARRAAEHRVTELQELVTRLMKTNDELNSTHNSTKRRKRIKKKKKSSTSSSSSSSSSSTISTRNNTLSRARKKQADRDRAAASASARRKTKKSYSNQHGMSLKEQVRLANLGKDPPFMPSGNPRVDNNVYSITQKQLANPLAYGNIASSSSSPPSAPSSIASSYILPTPKVKSPLGHNNGADNGNAGGLDAVIDAIRHELDALTTRRDTLLQNAANSPDGHLNLDQNTIDIALGDLQKKIDSKSRQIILLEKQLNAQSFNSSSKVFHVEARKRMTHSPSRSPLRDTEASEKKQAALDLLRHYKTTSVEAEVSHLNELGGRSLAASGGGVSYGHGGGNSTSTRRGTYFGTYDEDEAAQLRELHKTASTFGM